MMQKTYKNETISFDEMSEEWTCGEIRDKSLKAVMLGIDKAVKSGFTRCQAYYSSYGGNKIYLAEVTSLTRDRTFAYITYERHDQRSKERLKASTQWLYAVTPENEVLVEQIEVCLMVIRQNEEEVEACKAKLTPLYS
jgi:hypothetical protein